MRAGNVPAQIQERIPVVGNSREYRLDAELRIPDRLGRNWFDDRCDSACGQLFLPRKKSRQNPKLASSFGFTGVSNCAHHHHCTDLGNLVRLAIARRCTLPNMQFMGKGQNEPSAYLERRIFIVANRSQHPRRQLDGDCGGGGSDNLGDYLLCAQVV